MAKKKKNDSVVGGVVLLITSLLGAIVLLTSFLAVFVMIGAWAYFSRAMKRYPGIRGQEDIRLSSEDREKLNDCRRTKVHIQQRIAAIESRKNDLLVRKDGKFDSRNNEGRSLNAELEILRSDAAMCTEVILQLGSWERRTYREWVTNKSGLFSSRIAVFSLPVSIAAFLFVAPSSMMTLSELIESQLGLAHPGQIAGFYGAISFGAWSSIAVFLLLWACSAVVAPKFAKCEDSHTLGI